MPMLSSIRTIALLSVLTACHCSVDTDRNKVDTQLSWVRVWQGDTLLVQETLFDSTSGNGLVRSFAQDGHIKRELLYESWNERLRREFYTNGSVASEQQEDPNQTKVTVWRLAHLVSISSYDSLGYECGTWREWHENGQLRSEGAFLSPPEEVQCPRIMTDSTIRSGVDAARLGPHNAKNGLWKYWSSEGRLLRLQYYDDGCLSIDSICDP